MTDARIAEALNHLGVDPTADLGDATLGGFVADSFGYGAAVLAVEQVIAEVFDLSEDDLAKYRTPADG
jgi:hypothetical protein